MKTEHVLMDPNGFGGSCLRAMTAAGEPICSEKWQNWRRWSSARAWDEFQTKYPSLVNFIPGVYCP